MKENIKKKLAVLIKKELSKRKILKDKYDWRLNARASQLPPNGDWSIWMILAGRGYGKTRTGAETIKLWVETGIAKRICLLGDTIDDVKKIMIEGESGLLSIYPDNDPYNKKPQYIASEKKLVWDNGAVAICYSAEAYESLRGPQFDTAWIDELAKFNNPENVFDQLMMCMRLGKHPRTIITTTPKPIKILKELIKRKDIYITHGTTYENSENLSQKYIEMLKTQYDGTSLGKQEIDGIFIEDNDNALWKKSMITYQDCIYSDCITDLHRIIIAIDPSVTNSDNSDETGIIVAGIDHNKKIYILDDLSGKMSPIEWINKAVDAFYHFKAELIIAEINNGGDLVENLLNQMHDNIPYKPIRTHKSKILRAQTIACLYERGIVFHTKPFIQLEEQMLSFSKYTTKYANGRSSPDRLDALVYAVNELHNYQEYSFEIF